MPEKYDFAGWVTKNDIVCADGVTIKHDAFKDNDQAKVPLVWEHKHSDPTNVLGHVILHNQDIGVYGYGHFNNTPEAQHAKQLIQHGDISAMSIAANKVKRRGNDVIHGRIFEVSLVLAAANPGALIETVMAHSDTSSEEVVIHTGTLLHSADDILEHKGEEKDMADNEKTVGEILETLTEEQMSAVETLLANVVESDDVKHAFDEDDLEEDEVEKEKDKITHSDKGGNSMKQNVFSAGNVVVEETLTHSQKNEILKDAMKNGSLKEAYLQHGITNIEVLFPEANLTTKEPVVYTAINTSAGAILNAVRKSPFARIKTMVADMTTPEARARGYIKGKEKIEQVYELLTRTTTPQTIYKKQKLDRDDVIDITDFDIVAFTQRELRVMLTEEIARALLVGDGREVISADKIKAEHIRPIASDDDFYTIKAEFDDVANLYEKVILSLAEYRGSGSPTMYVHPTLLAELKLLKATDGRFLFGDLPSDAQIAGRLGVREIVPTTFLPVDSLLIVNLADYTLGASKGGEVTTFDDFDIDFNQYKYLIETRISGALTLPKSAVYVTKATPVVEP